MVFHVDFKALVCCVSAVLTLTNRLLQKHPTPLFFLLLLLELVPVVWFYVCLKGEVCYNLFIICNF